MYIIILCIHVYACEPPYCCCLALSPRKNDWRSEFVWNNSFLQIHNSVQIYDTYTHVSIQLFYTTFSYFCIVWSQILIFTIENLIQEVRLQGGGDS